MSIKSSWALAVNFVFYKKILRLLDTIKLPEDSVYFEGLVLVMLKNHLQKTSPDPLQDHARARCQFDIGVMRCSAQ